MADLFDDGQRVVEIDPALIKVSKWNPRSQAHLTGEEQLELTTSIANVGQLMPALIVRADDGYELVAGSRRLAAVRQLGRNLRAIVLESLAEADIFAKAHAENSGHQAVSFWEQARSFGEAMASGLFRTESELAEAVHRHKGTVSRAMSFINAPSEILDLFSDPRTIAARQWIPLAPLLNDPKAREKVLRRAAHLATLPPMQSNAIIASLIAAGVGARPPRTREVKNEFGRKIATLRMSATGGIAISISSLAELHRSQRAQALTTIHTELRKFVTETFE